MTKDVLISISGLHTDPIESDGNEPIEIISPATYYLKNGKHYILYDEPVEGTLGVIKNKVKVTGDTQLEIIKTGAASAHMVFENNKMHMTEYETPYGVLVIGIYTKKMTVEEQDNEIKVFVQYALEMNDEKVADCLIKINVKPCGLLNE